MRPSQTRDKFALFVYPANSETHITRVSLPESGAPVGAALAEEFYLVFGWARLADSPAGYPLPGTDRFPSEGVGANPYVSQQSVRGIRAHVTTLAVRVSQDM